MLQGMMFLPDGRVLIMDNELFKKTIDSSIVLDLLDTDSSNTASTAILDVIQHQMHTGSRAGPATAGHDSVEEEKQSISGGA